MSYFDDIISRLMTAFGAKTAIELAGFIGKNQSTISKWRSRGKVPNGVIAQVAALTNVNYDWLLTGKGEMHSIKGKIERDHLDPELARMIMAELQSRKGKEPLQLSATDAAIIEMLHDMPEEDRKRVEYEIMTAWVACRRKGR